MLQTFFWYFLTKCYGNQMSEKLENQNVTEILSRKLIQKLLVLFHVKH